MGRKYLKDIGIDIKEGCVPGGGDVSILTDDRVERFKKQIEEYGFDDRETWNLNYTSVCWLYEHLMMFKEIGGEVVDLSFYKFNVEVAELNRNLNEELFEEYRNSEGRMDICDIYKKELTQGECIDTVIEYLKYFIQVDDGLYDYDSAEISILREVVSIEKLRTAFRIYAEIVPAMWW